MIISTIKQYGLKLYADPEEIPFQYSANLEMRFIKDSNFAGYKTIVYYQSPSDLEPVKALVDENGIFNLGPEAFKKRGTLEVSFSLYKDNKTVHLGIVEYDIRKTIGDTNATLPPDEEVWISVVTQVAKDAIKDDVALVNQKASEALNSATLASKKANEALENANASNKAIETVNQTKTQIEDKANEFDTNYQEKLSAFNENATEKQNTFNQSVTSANNAIDEKVTEATNQSTKAKEEADRATLATDGKLDKNLGAENANKMLGTDETGAIIVKEANDVVIKHSKNLFNIEKSVIGGIQYNGSISTSGNWSKYKTSELIPVKKDIQYTLSQFLNSNPYSDRLVMILYDNKGKPLQETYNNITSAQSHTFTSQIDGYVRVSTNFSNPSKQLMLEVGDSATEYEEWWEKRYTNLYVPIDRLPIHDALYGKKWIPCGDSFTDYTNALFNSGKFKGKAKTYPRLISERCGIEISQTFFASGRTLAYPEDESFTNSLTCQTEECYYKNIPEDADYITIMLGINDGHHRDSSSAGDGEDNTGIIPIGTIDDNTTSTYYGAWNVVLSWLIENRPFAHIGILISNGVDTVDYRNAQLEIAKKYGIPYIDLNGDERTPTMIRSQNPNISSVVKTIVNKKQAVDYDGSLTGTVNTHPNSEAHEYESYFIENFLRSI